MEKRCPRCGKRFSCRMDDLLECHCIGIVLNPDALQYLQVHYSDCLCHQCLQAVQAMFASESPRAYP